MADITHIGSLATARATLSGLRELLSDELVRATARFTTGLATAEAAEDAMDDVISRIEYMILAAPADDIRDVATKVRCIQRQAEAGAEFEMSDFSPLFADILRLAERP